ncbi:MAG: type II secretion system F family protein [Candidatus Pacebacteria bacterium]|nr:type II secretion system F family protein [Candidatus Paceibacterota bacterium]
MKFHYVSQSKTGTMNTGDIEGADKHAVLMELRDKEETVLSLTPLSEKGSWLDVADRFLGKVSLKEKIFFTHNVSSMLSAGLALSRALSILEKQTKNKLFKSILHDIQADIQSGKSFSQSLEKYPKVFEPFFISMVRSGEESGGMPDVLSEISVHLEKTYTLKRKIKGALMYPAVVLCAIIIIGVLMMIYVVPTLTAVFTDMEMELPASTRFIMTVSDLLRNHIILLIGGVAAFFSGITWLARTEKGTRFFDWIIPHIPVIGGIVQQSYAAQTARTLSSLLSSGVNMGQSLEITRDVLQNVHYKNIIIEAQKNVEKGETLSIAFKGATRWYPLMVGEMMEVGEETGKLSTMLLEIAHFYEEEVSAATKDLSTIVEPILMIFVGGAVGFFAVSMITPMYSLMEGIS